METLARRARRGWSSAGSKSLAILTRFEATFIQFCNDWLMLAFTQL
jgi:hypothetical protein